VHCGQAKQVGFHSPKRSALPRNDISPAGVKKQGTAKQHACKGKLRMMLANGKWAGKAIPTYGIIMHAKKKYVEGLQF
jgi:hypothetical protein